MSQIIAMWSGPRNLSTAMMRSFGARADTSVMDEPFFAPFLDVSGKSHPGRAETLATHDTDPQKVAADCARARETAYVFQKHMPHHMLDGFPMDWAAPAKNFFLIRHPRRVIASYAKGRAEFTSDDLGYGPQCRLWTQFGRPPVVDCDDILRAPYAAMRALCSALNIPFDPAMLSWEAGPRVEDGAWAPYWYASVERSTGFGAAPKELPEIAPKYLNMLADAERDYAKLAAVALKF